jgi:hypothetical protein
MHRHALRATEATRAVPSLVFPPWVGAEAQAAGAAVVVAAEGAAEAGNAVNRVIGITVAERSFM